MRPHDTTMPHELTDEELGRLAFDAYYASGDDEETVEDWTNVARAVREAVYPPEWRRGDALLQQLVADLTDECERLRAELAALTPAVTPLAPGETVTIQDCMAPVTSLRLEQFGLNEHILQVAVMRRGQDDPAAFAVIGRVGAAQVREACDRFLAAHNDQPEDTEAAFFGPAQGEITVRGKFSGYQRLVPLIAPEDAEGLENG